MCPPRVQGASGAEERPVPASPLRLPSAAPTRAQPHFSGFSYLPVAWIFKLLHISYNTVDLILVTFHSNPRTCYLIALFCFLDFFIHCLSHNLHSFLRRVLMLIVCCETSSGQSSRYQLKRLLKATFLLSREAQLLVLESHTSLEKARADVGRPECCPISQPAGSKAPVQPFDGIWSALLYHSLQTHLFYFTASFLQVSLWEKSRL